MLIEGDFAQTCSIVSRGNRVQTVQVSIYKTVFWQYIEILHLIRNMWVDTNVKNITFAA